MIWPAEGKTKGERFKWKKKRRKRTILSSDRNVKKAFGVFFFPRLLLSLRTLTHEKSIESTERLFKEGELNWEKLSFYRYNPEYWNLYVSKMSSAAERKHQPYQFRPDVPSEALEMFGTSSTVQQVTNENKAIYRRNKQMQAKAEVKVEVFFLLTRFFP